MTTCADVILLALKDINLIDENETPSSAVLSDSFTTLKQMLNLWQIDGASIYATQDVTFTPTGALSYTIGATGTVNTVARPDSVKYIYHVVGTLSYPMLDMLATRDEYESISLKSLQSLPYCAYYEPSYPNGTLFIYPQPNSGTIHFGIDAAFTDYTAAANDLLLPPEYAMPIRFNLGAILGATLGIGVPARIEKLAQDTKRVLDRNNLLIPRHKSNSFVSHTAKFQGDL